MRRALLALASLLAAAPAAAQTRDYAIETVVEGLSGAWAMAFLPDGGILITEKKGRLRIVRDGELRKAPVEGVPDVYDAGQGGLMEIVLHPDFETNRLVYFTYAYGTPDENATRVARARLVDDRLQNVEPVFTVAPLKDTPVHYGGRLAFLPDGTLLLTTGDGFDYREAAQDPGSGLGKIVRIDEAGGVPADNPFLGDPDFPDELWSLGHRNPQGLLVDPETGRVYESEHGPRGGDEINLIEPGENYGWPVATFGIDYSGARISPYTEYEGMTQPIFQWTPSIAPADLAICRGCAFPEWEGDLFAPALAGKHVARVDMEDGAPVGEKKLFEAVGARFRAAEFGPDGALYLLTDKSDGRLLRVTPE